MGGDLYILISGGVALSKLSLKSSFVPFELVRAALCLLYMFSWLPRTEEEANDGGEEGEGDWRKAGHSPL